MACSWCYFKRLLFYVVVFLPLIVVPFAIGTLVDCLALATSGVFALTVFPVIVDRHLNAFFGTFTPTASYTYGYGRAGILFQLMCHVASSTICVTLFYLGALRFYYEHSPLKFDPMTLDICCGAVLAISFLIAIVISCVERHSKNNLKEDNLDIINDNLIDGSSSEEMGSIHSRQSNLCLEKRRKSVLYSSSLQSGQQDKSCHLHTSGETILSSSSGTSFNQKYSSTVVKHNQSKFGFTHQQYFLLWCYVVSNAILLAIVIVMKQNPTWEILDALYPMTMSILFTVINISESFYIISILITSTPSHVNVDQLVEHLRRTYPSIKGVHNTRIWRLTPHRVIFMAHLLVDSTCDKNDLLWKVYSHLKATHHFENVTLQIEDELFC